MTTTFALHGHNVTVDTADLPLFHSHRWQIHKTRNNIYLRTTIGGHYVKLHRLLLGVTDRKQLVDHRDGNGLNNSRDNLRLATNAQNACNMRKKKGSSQFKGVFLDKKSNKWRAEIGVNFAKIRLGSFTNEMAAAVAYDLAAIKYHGEFARTNFSPVLPTPTQLQQAA